LVPLITGKQPSQDFDDTQDAPLQARDHMPAKTGKLRSPPLPTAVKPKPFFSETPPTPNSPPRKAPPSDMPPTHGHAGPPPEAVTSNYPTVGQFRPMWQWHLQTFGALFEGNNEDFHPTTATDTTEPMVHVGPDWVHVEHLVHPPGDAKEGSRRQSRRTSCRIGVEQGELDCHVGKERLNTDRWSDTLMNSNIVGIIIAPQNAAVEDALAQITEEFACRPQPEESESEPEPEPE